jgi:3-deoxy-D-manno-octulosonic acid kinase
MSEGQFIATAGGGILYDASRVSKPDEDLFSRTHWAARGALDEIAGGRSSIAVLNTGSERWVLRHYRRGGMMAKVSQDSYLWTGVARTRSFAEWRLLAELRRRGLPVPAPIAARYVRGLFTYRADLITELLPASRTLADVVTGAELPEAGWRAVGKTIAAFHHHGVHHADLNAHNILFSGDDTNIAHDHAPAVYLLDFDRGRIEARGAWEQAVLARLHRSLEKVKSQRADVRFGAQQWQWLMEGVSGQR